MRDSHTLLFADQPGKKEKKKERSANTNERPLTALLYLAARSPIGLLLFLFACNRGTSAGERGEKREKKEEKREKMRVALVPDTLSSPNKKKKPSSHRDPSVVKGRS